MDGQPSSVNFLEPLRAQLLSECLLMAQFALSNGKELPQPILDALDVVDRGLEEGVALSALAELHGQLLRVVAPATPSGLRLVQDDEKYHTILHVLGPVPSVRYLMLAAMLFSVMFFGVSLFPQINHQTLSRDIYDSHGVELLIPLVFLLSAAGLGATFGALFEAYLYVSEGSYDTKFDSVYWARIGLGLVSGLMLSSLLPQNNGTGEVLERPLLALLGGFSAAVLHRILQRLVSALEGVFVPEVRSVAALNERAVRQRPVEELRPQRDMLARSFDQLLEHVAAGGSVSDARKALVGLLSGRSEALVGLVDKGSKAAVDTVAGTTQGGLTGAGQRVSADVGGGDATATGAASDATVTAIAKRRTEG
jgi:hypothetical protein